MTGALSLAGWVCLGAGAFGAVLAVTQFADPRHPRLPWIAGALHGALGAAGVALLFAALRRPGPAAPPGTAGFGAASLIVLGLALAAGIGLGALRLARRRFGLGTVGIHASLAIAGLALLAARLFA